VGHLAAIMRGVSSNLIPDVRHVNDGPPVARIIPFGAAMMAAIVVAGYFAGLPTASSLTTPFFALPIAFLASHRRHVVSTGYALLSLGCVLRVVAAFFVPGFTAGQVMTACAGWGWMAWNFTLMAMMVMARGVRHPRGWA